MTYLVVVAHLALVLWGTRIVCLWVHDRRVPRPEDVRAVQIVCGLVVVVAAIAIASDLTDSGKSQALTRLFWEFVQLLGIVFAAMLIQVLRISSLPRAGKGDPASGQ